ncbi:hypothetical protein HQN89_21945 [Paenibacillus frigoriresistens]|uniref:hypothetical protein n=1 Tax=Paenibacillus alginolyticus TaxID=59839 RepID=UPI00156392A5|nr:hypothetical protein [Paenibacillus frigoriresistens]NRF93610.1 hypothetical protein [Paenibacillus frigoriresistens]
MYKSVNRDGKFLVLVVDGIFDAPLMELPTEELADKVAFELQSAWDQGVAWGVYQKQIELDGDGINKDTSKVIQKLRDMSPVEREAYHQRVNRRNERVQKVEKAKRWKSVLSWKNSMGE